MAYTYADFEKAVNSANLMGQFSQYDLDLARQNPDVGMGLLSAKQQWARATTDAERQAANAAAEALRAQNGSYTGGSWGLEYNPFGSTGATGGTTDPMGAFDSSKYQTPSYTPSTGSAPSFDASAFGSAPTFNQTVGSAPTYSSQYTDQINAGLANLQNRPDFSFDEVQPEYIDRYGELVSQMLGNVTGYGDFNYEKATDPVWQALAKQYRREGDRAFEGTLAAAAAANGGALSSNAIYAAQMAQNNYNANLGNIIPQLYADAYGRHVSDFGIAMDKYGAAQQAEQSDYNKYLNALNQFNANRDFAWNQYTGEWGMDMDAYNAALAADKNAYNQYLGQLDQYNADRTYEFNKYLAELDQYNADRNFGLDSYQTQLNQYNNDRNFGYDQYRDTVADNQYQQEFDYMVQQDAYDRMIDEQRYADELALAQLKAASKGNGGGGGNNDTVDNSAYQKQIQELEEQLKYLNGQNEPSLNIPTLVNDDGSPVKQSQVYDKVLSGEWTRGDLVELEQAIVGTFGAQGNSFYQELLSIARP